ncbi:DUF664 domain-containing protein [Amycolatopsis sp. DSM 110486]|uniref:mycothiol transferase n=1 Tax=Amycolatopsis sp. DSM 110486 TaxID=2865832 RepID=UPI00351CFDA6
MWPRCPPPGLNLADVQAAEVVASRGDSPGYVPWWPRPDVMLFNVLVHMLTETSRHAGHADILREQLDGEVEMDAAGMARRGQDAAFWESRRAEIERAAKAADPATA